MLHGDFNNKMTFKLNLRKNSVPLFGRQRWCDDVITVIPLVAYKIQIGSTVFIFTDCQTSLVITDTHIYVFLFHAASGYHGRHAVSSETVS